MVVLEGKGVVMGKGPRLFRKRGINVCIICKSGLVLKSKDKFVVTYYINNHFMPLSLGFG